jgi:hypothetical protein
MELWVPIINFTDTSFIKYIPLDGVQTAGISTGSARPLLLLYLFEENVNITKPPEAKRQGAPGRYPQRPSCNSMVMDRSSQARKN